ncbi:MAG: hypothetical protein ABGX33_06170 [Cycloclasticus sp.]
MNAYKSTGIALAIAAAAMMGTTVATASPDSSKSASQMVHCYGVNKCGGHNDCKTASNACMGKASCKGTGYVKVSEKACDDIGGKVGE